MRTIICKYFQKTFLRRLYIYPFFEGISLISLQFIDDIFFRCTGTKDQLTNCLNNLNKKHSSVKFEFKISQTSITLLDTEVTIQNTKTYQKSTDRH